MPEDQIIVSATYPLWKKLVTILISSLLTAGLFYYITQSDGIISPIGEAIREYVEKPRSLEKYSFKALSQRQFTSSPIELEEVLISDDQHTSYLFSILVEESKVTGQLNIPKSSPPQGGFPVVVMNRGFIDPSIYQTGMGTKNAAGYFASEGFITIAPDFLGFGDSDQEDIDPMAARVKKPVTTLTVLHSIDQLNTHTSVNMENIFMWGHSNGGQISLSVLQILGNSPYWNKPIPTTLWAPVTKGFPYNILYYTDDGDYGKALRKVLFEFELKYDTDNYSIHSYMDWIESPMQVHQGTVDKWIPTQWSRDFVTQLTDLEKEATLFTYTGADHNLKPHWESVVLRDVSFYNSYIE